VALDLVVADEAPGFFVEEAAPDFAVSAVFGVVAPLEAWPAIAPGMKTLVASSAHSAPSRVFRIPVSGTVANLTAFSPP
jgi:hypothetical protein